MGGEWVETTLGDFVLSNTARACQNGTAYPVRIWFLAQMARSREAKLKALREAQEATEGELKRLEQAILDKAFRGEL